MANRIAIGDVGGVWKIAVSKSGVDVLTAGPGDLILDSEATHMRSVQVGQFVIEAGDLEGSASVTGLTGTTTFGGRVAQVVSGEHANDLVATFDEIEVTPTAVSAKLRSAAGADITMAYHVLAW